MRHNVSCCKYVVLNKFLDLNCDRLSSLLSKMTTLVFRPTMTSFVMMRRMKKEMAMILEMKVTEAQSLLGNEGVMMRHVYIHVIHVMSSWIIYFIFRSSDVCVNCFRMHWKGE